MQKVIFTRGLPASGKSTWSKQYAQEHHNFIRVCRDDLRNMRGKYWLPKQESLITAMEQVCIASALECGYNVIVDATNFNEKYLNILKQICLDSVIEVEDKSEVEFEIKDFTDVPLEECIKRDSLRANSVGEQVIRDFYNKNLRPKYEVDNTPSRHCVICDLDGTLCNLNGRSPYDTAKCSSDIVNKVVRNIIWGVRGTEHIIFMSGREEKYRDLTVAWLKANSLGEDGIEYDLYMRPTGDQRKDCIVKRELFFKHINGKFRVTFVMDDRNQVVDMWRNELKLQCLQVAEGNF